MNRRGALLAGLAAALPLPAAAGPAPALSLNGRFVQGGFAMGRTAPRADILVDGRPMGAAGASGLFVVGFDRDSPATQTILARTASGEVSRTVDVAKGTFDIQRINGLAPDQVSPSDPAQIARILEEAKRKAAGLASRADSEDFQGGFSMPVRGAVLTGHFGGQRILNGQPKKPHYGCDLAAAVGTPITAPAPGVVSFAESGLHYEGRLAMIDHGQGLVSMYLHMSRMAVQRGQRVERGQLIGAVGMEGRATGPHLCWRLKWRDRNLNALYLVGAHAPAA